MWIRGALAIAVYLFVSGASYAGDPFVGASIYTEHCASCHGARGKAVIAGTPDFVGTFVLAKPDFEIKGVIESGRGIMPAFRGVLRDKQINDVIAYIRTFN
jgi:mono/diheme cytochrome c family protein